MDFLSVILAALGWGRDHSAESGGRKTEAYRLNAEVAGECLRSLSALALATPPLIRRLEALYPGQPEAYKSCAEALATLQSQCQQIYTMAETNKAAIENAGRWHDWEKALRASHQWRATISSMCPHVEGVIRQLEAVVTQEEQRRIAGTPPASPTSFLSQRDRGWDAPPL
ncbi:hypothetical protein ASE23_11955 [Rhizobium sp. Root73]|nr:hypothetical protein ASC96_13615 [Rhizobium sp. Root1204]KQY03524.1 hypothetical protein ASD36_14145 [Rhizobium sp. Root1334]KRC00172.1 hypothetical protein ASE23_11955 [Rhizobium sp. Root73]